MRQGRNPSGLRPGRTDTCSADRGERRGRVEDRRAGENAAGRHRACDSEIELRAGHSVRNQAAVRNQAGSRQVVLCRFRARRIDVSIARRHRRLPMSKAQERRPGISRRCAKRFSNECPLDEGGHPQKMCLEDRTVGCRNRTLWAFGTGCLPCTRKSPMHTQAAPPFLGVRPMGQTPSIGFSFYRFLRRLVQAPKSGFPRRTLQNEPAR